MERDATLRFLVRMLGLPLNNATLFFLQATVASKLSQFVTRLQTKEYMI